MEELEQDAAKLNFATPKPALAVTIAALDLNQGLALPSTYRVSFE